MANLSLAVKYRPKTFDGLCEQEYVKAVLRNQIKTKSFVHAYLFTGPAGCGKTTSARIFAINLNEGKGTPIEIDAASNTGVDNIRIIIEDSKKRALDSEYKTFIIDECVEGKTEILTDSGWKRIDSISDNEVVAQYTDKGTIEFVPIQEYIVKDYKGSMYNVSFRNGKKSVLMSPHHVQPVRMKQSGKIVEKYIQDCKFAQTNEIITGGCGTGNDELLTSLDKLFIACQADGYCGLNNLWELHLSIPDKINRALELLDDCGIDYKIYGDKSKSIRFYINFPSTKKFSDYFTVNMGVNRAKDFISEILLWDGSVKSGYPGYYSCTDKDNVDFVGAVLVQCGYSGNQGVIHYDNPNHNDVHHINWYYNDARPSTAVSKELVNDYEGKIYCVKVPSHKIVLRAEGFTFISGNCHMLSNGAWNAMLKLLEEPPAKTIFIMCTTDPQKIPATILSRVQRYDFTKIPTDIIEDRLRYIISEENKNSDSVYNIDDDVYSYIAKLSGGGMRDAITMLDKCLALSTTLDVVAVSKVLGTVDYDVMFLLLEGITGGKPRLDETLDVVDDVFNSGADIKTFVKQFMFFVKDVLKIKVFKSFSTAVIPRTEEYDIKIADLDGVNCLKCLEFIMSVDRTIKWDSNPKDMFESMLILYECGCKYE